MQSGTYQIHTLGCKANWNDSQEIEAQLRAGGMNVGASDDDPEVIVVNSCTVTDEADKQSRKLAERLKKKHPRSRVVFTGCSAEVSPDVVDEVAVVANRDKGEFRQLLKDSPESGKLGRAEGYTEMHSRHPMDREWPLPSSRLVLPVRDGVTNRTRAFLKIQDGCNVFCTYCVIPYGRGPSRSLKPNEVVTAIQGLTDHGYKEVVITGINIGEYGLTKRGHSLEPLLRRVLTETEIERVRLSSLNPVEITPELMRLMDENERLCPHFHVSLQSVDDEILKKMKRGYTSKDVIRCLNDIASMKRKPFVGMDLITGFPGETTEVYEKSKELLAEMPWSRLHVFPYSERSGTPATRLNGVVDRGERKRRSRELNALSLERLKSHYEANKGRAFNDVLIEGSVKGPGAGEWVSGYTPDYTRFILKKANLKSNTYVSAQAHTVIIDASGHEVSFLGTLESATT
jgi:threonylcarbamoyladenosine tRNA methylthiotransferase MtaB